jgi:hypothetical protein
VERKARQYLDSSGGKIQAVLVLDLEYPEPKKAWVSLLVADGSSSSWAKVHELFYDDALELNRQPAGQIDLYLSDFLGFSGLPAAACRPSTAELETGITRFIVLLPGEIYYG